AGDLIKIVAVFHRKRFVAALVDMAFPDPTAILLPARDMRHRQSLHERRQITIVFGPQNEMPEIGHQTVAANPHRRVFPLFLDHGLSRRVKQALASDATVQNVIDHSTRSYAIRSWHGDRQNTAPRSTCK